MRTVSVAILGFGTVGSGVYKILTQNYQDIAHRESLDMQVKHILIRGFDCEPNIALASLETFTMDMTDIVNDATIDIVIECLGGTEPSRTYILAALAAGKTVVTSNKEVIAKHWPELEEAAKSTKSGLYIEATVGGGMPIIRTLLDSMQANNIELLMGIINGTTNYILTKMSEEGQTYEQALKDAQALGYAEANPAADVEGWDSVYKLSILSSIAFHARVPIEVIYREGITQVTYEDIMTAKELGYVIKLLAIGKKIDGKIQVRVHPVLLPSTHPIAAVRSVFNAVFLHGHAVDDIMLYGRGAGQMPTASAVVSDVLYAIKTREHRYMTFENTISAPQTLNLLQDWLSGFSIRLTVKDEVGALSKLSSVFAENGVSIHSVLQRGTNNVGNVSIIFIAHTTKELSMRAAIEALRNTDVVLSVDSIMRVER